MLFQGTVLIICMLVLVSVMLPSFFFRLLRGGEASGGGLSQSTSVGMASLVSATFPLCYPKHTQHNVSVNLLIFIIFNLNSHFFQYAQLTFLRKHSSKCSSQTTQPPCINSSCDMECLRSLRLMFMSHFFLLKQKPGLES